MELLTIKANHLKEWAQSPGLSILDVRQPSYRKESFLMRKILLVVLIVSIFSFSIVYAQEIYGMDGRDDQKTQQAMSREDTLEEDKKEEKETDVSDLEEAAQDKEVNTSSISESEDGGQAVSDNRDNQENTNKSTNNDTAKVKTSKKTNDVVSNSKQKSPEAKNTKNIEVKKKESANEAPKPKNTANSTTEVDGSPVIIQRMQRRVPLGQNI